MKKNLIILNCRILAMLIFMMVFACTDRKWDDYYTTPEYSKNGGILDHLKMMSNYKEFTSLLTKTGYDSILGQNNMFTILAVPNGAFSAIDTTSNIDSLKKVLGMHIYNSALNKEDLADVRIKSLSGKYLKFKQIGELSTVNGIQFNPANVITLNGVIHEINQVIVPKPNLYELITGKSEFSLFKSYIDTHFTQIPDPDLNIKIGNDSLNNPVYQPPVIYKTIYDYRDLISLDDEKVVSTMFVPTNTAVNKVLQRLLDNRAGNSAYIIPKLGINHGDTIIGAYFIPKNTAFAGDTALVLDYLFRNCVIRGEIASPLTGTNSFDNIMGNQFVVTDSQIREKIDASNGSYYPMNDITIPGSVLRPTFMFLPRRYVIDPVTKANTATVNPYIVYSGVTNTAPVESAQETCYTRQKTAFNFTAVGGEVKFIFPYVIHGKYQAVLNYYPDDTGAIVSFQYGVDYISQNFNSSSYYLKIKRMTTFDLGLINVAADGQIDFTVTCMAVSLKNSSGYQFHVDLIKLIPVD